MTSANTRSITRFSTRAATSTRPGMRMRGEGGLALVMARVAGVAVALPASLVLRMQDVGPLAVIPRAHPALRGLVAAQGQPLTVIDGAWLLGLDQPPIMLGERFPALILSTAAGRLALPLDDRRFTVVRPLQPVSRPATDRNATCALQVLVDLPVPGTDALLVDPAALDQRLELLRLSSSVSQVHVSP